MFETDNGIMPIRKPENFEQYIESGCGRCKLGNTPQCKVHTWNTELSILRDIIRESGLTEEIKWGSPCYTDNGKNIVMLSVLKAWTLLSFFRGTQMKDNSKILVPPGENSRFMRCIRFNDANAIPPLKTTLLNYIGEAIELERSGEKALPIHDEPRGFPDELSDAFREKPELKDAFLKLTPGRQRGYLLHFSSAKQTKTRSDRIMKCMPGILAGKGWNER